MMEFNSIGEMFLATFSTAAFIIGVYYIVIINKF